MYYPASPSFLLFIILSVLPQISVSRGDEYYRACAPKRFECGDLRDNISYPFEVGDGRPGYCGQPGYRITCVENSPEIQIGSKTYRVIDRQIDYVNQLLTIVEKQFADNEYCPIPSTEDDSLPEPPLFRLANPSSNVTLWYGCSDSFSDPSWKRINCFQDDGGNFSYYTVTYPTPSPTEAKENCSVSVLPVLPEAYALLAINRFSIEEVVRVGFQVYCSAGNEGWCHRCRGAGGLCGSHPSDPNSPACFCPDQSQYPDCVRSPPGTLVFSTIQIEASN